MKVRLLHPVENEGLVRYAGAELELDAEQSAALIRERLAVPAQVNRAVGLQDSDTPELQRH